MGMRAVGVICEFNPLHNGHVRLLSRMRREVGDDGCVVCAMSGRFVQRGEPAVADPYVRAAMALAGGADLVVELPFPWSCGSAERFADAGVSILAGLGVEAVAFGSETGDEKLLSRAAACIGEPTFRARVAALLRTDMGSTAAYTLALREALGEHIPPHAEDALGAYGTAETDTLPDNFPSPNDRLAIAYLRAIRTENERRGTSLRPLIVRREGQAFDDTTLSDCQAPSATALRLLLREAADDPAALSAMLDGTMPKEALKILLSAVDEGLAPTDMSALLPFFHALFRLSDPSALAGIAELNGGLSDRMIRAAREAACASAFPDALHTRLYTDARLRRGMLYAATGVLPADVTAAPTYTTLLAATTRGCRFLRAEATVPRAEGEHTGQTLTVVTKPADAPAGRQRTLCEKADALYTLTYPVPTDAAALWRRKPLICGTDAGATDDRSR